jgi:hypothetical protein
VLLIALNSQRRWNAVALGAVTREAGIAGTRSPPLKFFAKHYGFQIPAGDDVRNVWLIRKGDIIIHDEEMNAKYDFSCTFPVVCRPQVKLQLVATADQKPPMWGRNFQNDSCEFHRNSPAIRDP